MRTPSLRRPYTYLTKCYNNTLKEGCCHVHHHEGEGVAEEGDLDEGGDAEHAAAAKQQHPKEAGGGGGTEEGALL